jgi:hypothetical protein
MTNTELIKKLQAFPPNAQVMILDGFNGAGAPREINLGPSMDQVTEVDALESADCEGLEGQFIITLGYGCY